MSTKAMENNQIQPKKGRGGYRPNGGRKKGSTQKLSAQTLLLEIAKKDKPYAIGLAEDYHAARTSGDLNLAHKYHQMILNKVVADKIDVDHTTMGQPLTASFQFPQKELPDWTNIEKVIKIEE